jgi:Coenzyme PQQ synthesis protein D (PqqD)
MTRFSKNDRGLCRKEFDNFIIYNTNTSTPYIMNETSHFIWELCDGTRTLDDIVGCFQAEYSFEQAPELEAQLPTLVYEHLTLLSKIGVVEPCEEAASSQAM